MALARLGAAVVPARDQKLYRTFRARRGLIDAWRTRVYTSRDHRRPLVWFHAPSVGEGLQARPIMQALRTARPDVQIAYTHFSPSAEEFSKSLNAELVGYLPFDSLSDMRALVDMLAPSAMMFVKLDVWPNLVRALHERNAPVGLLSGTMAPRSARQGALAGLVLREAYRTLSTVGVIDAADAERLIHVGVDRARVHVTGDTRFDQVWERARAVDRTSAALRALHSPRPKVVAGSTWPSDQRVLFRAWRDVHAKFPDAQLVIAPHEPSKQHLAELVADCKRLNLSHTWLTSLLPSHRVTERLPSIGRPFSAAETDVIIIDTVGVLGDAYALADIAYVGGGFRAAGLHSVLEPAAYGVPVMFGPAFDMSREARLLIAARGAQSIIDAAEMAATFAEWLDDSMDRAEWGARARQFVEQGRGAAERSLQLVLAEIPDR
jgi:3-deoxy-D-manno-octulosonic-acid transferase